VYTFRRCHSTVCGLMNSSAPIFGFVMPPAARAAICDSCGVRALAVPVFRALTCSPVATSSRRAR
jgi:hypothetical protein